MLYYFVRNFAIIVQNLAGYLGESLKLRRERYVGREPGAQLQAHTRLDSRQCPISQEARAQLKTQTSLDSKERPS